MTASIIREDRTYSGAVSFGGTVNLPAAAVSDNSVIAGANIQGSKLIHRHAIEHQQKNGADVASETILKHIAHAAGTVLAVYARVTTAPTGGDKAFTIKVQKAANGSGSWTDLLSAPISFAAGDSNDTIKVGTLSVTAYNGTDALRVVITTSGSTGSQGQGLDVLVVLDELPA